MFERIRPPIDPVSIRLDGRELEAERGEPLTHALLASVDVAGIARSPKLHRPRGPSCLRGGCDGCLARVNGEPNVMTCLRAVAGGEEVETQNILGTRNTDLLRLTDWLFPRGIDHHHLFAGVPLASELLSNFARKLAGTGKLPDVARPVQAAEHVALDALVVGGGLAGIVTAHHLARRGHSTWLVDDARVPGLAALAAGAAAASAVAAHPLAGVVVKPRATACGVYEARVLVASEAGAVLVEPRALILATGAHDRTLLVGGNDLPGVFSARALAQLACAGIVPTGGVVIVGRGAFADALGERLGTRVVARVEEEDVEAVLGTSTVRGLRLCDGRELEARVVALALAGAPSFELGLQAGASTRWCGRGFALSTDEQGRSAEGVWAAGECTGADFEADELVRAGRRVAESVAAYLDAGGRRAAEEGPEMVRAAGGG